MTSQPDSTSGPSHEGPESRAQPERGSLFDSLAQELRRIAGSLARQNDTLQPTALVNEAFLKLSNKSPGSWNDEHHFLRSAAVTMRSILIDHKKAKTALKRGGHARHSPLDETLKGLESDWGGDIEAVHEALLKLEAEDAVVAEYVNLRFFAGRTNLEACAVLAIGERTGGRYWKFARAWLHQQLSR